MKSYTVIDLEWTSWKNNYYGRYLQNEKRKKWQKKEIIEIGAIKFDEKFKVKSKIRIIVKPKINKKLSKYICSLTSLNDKIIKKKGIDFLKAYKKLKNFTYKTHIFCNGSDNLVLMDNLKYNKIKSKKLKIINIKKILELKYKIPKKYLHSPKIKTYFGYKYNKKKAHHALFDCESILLAMRKLNFNLSYFKNV